MKTVLKCSLHSIAVGELGKYQLIGRGTQVRMGTGSSPVVLDHDLVSLLGQNGRDLARCGGHRSSPAQKTNQTSVLGPSGKAIFSFSRTDLASAISLSSRSAWSSAL